MRCLLLAFALGVLALQQQAELPAAAQSVWVAVFLAVALLFHRVSLRAPGSWRRGAAAFVAAFSAAVALGLVGFFYGAWRAELRLADALPGAWEGREIEVVGVIDELPQPFERGTRFAFAVERVITPGAAVPERLSLGWYASARAELASDELPALHGGERWDLTVRLKRPHGTVNPHGFDGEAWLLENQLRATGYVRESATNRRLDAFAGRPADYVVHLREAIRARILAVLDGRAYAGVIAALAIGDERAISPEQWRIFNRTGIGHLISISGLHVTFFATLIGAVVFWLWRRSQALTLALPARKAAAVAGVVAAFVYVLLAGFQVPAQRTLYMLAVAAIGLWLGRPGSASVVWLWALAVVLAWDPWAALAPGFWLSFGAVGLLLYTGVGRAGSPSALGAAARAQWAITLGLVPFMLMLFQQVSLVSPLANALAIPAVTFVVVPLTLASLVMPWDLLLVAAHHVFAWLAVLLEYLSALPAAVWQQHAPPLWAVLAGAAGVLWLLAPHGLPGRALGLAWVAPLFLIAPLAPAPGAFQVTVLDVGQGLAVLVQTHAHALLYDTGPRYNEAADAGGRIVAPVLRATGVSRLDGLVVSHQDSDHSGGALSLLETMPVAWLASSLPADNAIVRARLERGEAAQRCLAGQRWRWDGVDFAVLHPVEPNYSNPKLKANDLSCVLKVSNAAGSVLLTGDIEARTEDDLVRREGAALRSDLLIVPHHGSRTSSTPAFIAAVAPAVAVFTPGYRNRFGHPRPEIVARYAEAGVHSYRTDYEGALGFAFAPGTALLPRVEREADRRYWRDAPGREELATSR
jgi:competence protein ComEC